MNKLEIPLDIHNVKIEKIEIKKGTIYITVKSAIEGTKCHKCGIIIDTPHGEGREIALRHLSILGMKVYILIRPIRYRCLYCEGKPTTAQKLDWYDFRNPHTKAYGEHILLSLVNSTVEDVSIKEDIGYEAIMGLIDRYIGQKVDWPKINTLEILGIDEISLKKGHKDFVTIVTGRVGGRTIILGVLEDRKKSTVKNFLQAIPKRIKRKIITICSDMYDGFINAAKEVFGNKVIVIDRFHVAKLYKKCLDNLRKSELKRLKKELSEEEYKKLKGVMWALRKKKKNLTGEEKEALDCLFTHSELLKIAYRLCNKLTDIFEENISKNEAKSKIIKWKKEVQKSILVCFDSFISTLDKYIDKITNYFTNRQTSGFVEGLNNKIKVLKRRCYGIINVTHLYKRIYLDLEGYKVFA